MTEEHHQCAIPSSPHPVRVWVCPCGCRYWSDGKQWWKWPQREVSQVSNAAEDRLRRNPEAMKRLEKARAEIDRATLQPIDPGEKKAATRKGLG